MNSKSVFPSLLRKSMRRLGAAVPAHVRRVRLRGLLAPALARIIHDAIAVEGRDRSEKGARRIAGPRRTVRTPQVRETPYDLCSKGIGLLSGVVMNDSG